MKRKTRKHSNRRDTVKSRSKNRHSGRPGKSARFRNSAKKAKGSKRYRKSSSGRARKAQAPNRRRLTTDPRVLRAIGLMRRDGISASKAARVEKMKLSTFRRGAGKYLHRSGPGKPWKARNQDELAVSMTVLTSRGPITAVVHSSRERKLLGQYNLALRMFRSGEEGATAALKAFEGETAGGEALITDPDLLITFEEAGQLDFDTLYTSFGSSA